MGLKSKIQRLLGLVDGHEEKIAEEVSKRTSISKEQAKKGISKAQEATNTDSSDRNT